MKTLAMDYFGEADEQSGRVTVAMDVDASIPPWTSSARVLSSISTASLTPTSSIPSKTISMTQTSTDDTL
ncbi:hypothetical protein CASFOL_004250 [Castilleja foliolosa]|uniref:Uncharacterized protein n=1 Tax=Castilleja foliolosa TaxID=1961234 RepID=A0ABD3CJG1_9LAMI